MISRSVASICFTVLSVVPVAAQDAQPTEKTENDPAVFQHVTPEEAAGSDNDRALVMGTYVLKADAVQQLRQVDTLMKTLNRIRSTDWKVDPWTKENADLTLRQRMDDYIQTAKEYYAGKGKRPNGVVGKRLEKFTDTELGDRSLSSALVSVQMAAAWDIPLQTGQAERLDAVLRQRLEMLRTPKK